MPSLKLLVEGGYNVVAVVTQPDKPVGRHGSTLQAPPVKQYALSKSIPVLQPERMKDEDFLCQLRAFDAHLQVVVAFRMLPKQVWNLPPFGTFNVHAALLPQYRGPPPSIGRSSMAKQKQALPLSSLTKTSTRAELSVINAYPYPMMPT